MSEIWSVLAPRQRRSIIWTQAVSIVMALSTVAGIASIAPFFAVLGNPQSIDHTRVLHTFYVLGGFSDRRSVEIALGIAFLALVLAANLINALGSSAMVRLAGSIGADLQSILFEEYLGRPYLFHARTHSAVLFNNIIHETVRATNDLLQNTFALIANMAAAAFIILAVVWLNPMVAAAMIVALGGSYVLIYLAVRNRLWRAGEMRSQFFIEQTKIVNGSLGAIKEVIIFKIQDFFLRDFDCAGRAAARAAARAELIGRTPRHLMECVAVAGLVILALVMGGRDGGIGGGLGQLTFLGFAAYRLLPTLQAAFAALVKIRADRPGFASIIPDLLLARARSRCAGAPPAHRQSGPIGEIRLTQVSFRYEHDRPAAVQEVSLRIAAYTAVGFVGPNGSGKTTVADLICGLLTPDSGRIEIDGAAVGDESRPIGRSRIAYVPQNIFLLDASIEANVALGIPAAAIDPERFQTATRLSQVDEFAGGLPGGYAFRIGERGMKLSGGQRQRIGIARALYIDAAVLVLDEATNALDGLTEHDLMSTLVRLRGIRTVIVIAHRLSTVRACDAIVEFSRGRIVCSGSYDDLLERSESFRELAALS